MKHKKIIFGILVVLLIISNLYFITKSRQLDYEILIGVPAIGEENASAGVNFTRSKPLKEKAEVNTVLFSLLHSTYIQNPQINEAYPDAILWISDPDENITYYQAALWVKEDSIILKRQQDENAEYSVIGSSYDTEELKHIIQRHIISYKGQQGAAKGN